LEDACFRDLERRIEGRQVTVGEALRVERPLLRELPSWYDTTEVASPRVDAKALVAVRQNHYSVPVALAGLRVQARIGAREILISHLGKEVTRHPRLQARFQTAARLDHYLELLQRKPGALKGSLPLRQERERGGWPGCFDELWRKLEERYGASEAARQMVDVLLLCRDHGPDRVELAVKGALAAGAHDGRAVALLASRSERPPQLQLMELPERLRTVDRPAPSLRDYDAYLGQGGAR
jgi:hypothetical protein